LIPIDLTSAAIGALIASGAGFLLSQWSEWLRDRWRIEDAHRQALTRLEATCWTALNDVISNRRLARDMAEAHAAGALSWKRLNSFEMDNTLPLTLLSQDLTNKVMNMYTDMRRFNTDIRHLHSMHDELRALRLGGEIEQHTMVEMFAGPAHEWTEIQEFLVVLEEELSRTAVRARLYARDFDSKSKKARIRRTLLAPMATIPEDEVMRQLPEFKEERARLLAESAAGLSRGVHAG
jgi:hypothetical protein